VLIVFIYTIGTVFSVTTTMLITYLAFGQFSWIAWLIGMGAGWISAYRYTTNKKKLWRVISNKGILDGYKKSTQISWR